MEWNDKARSSHEHPLDLQIPYRAASCAPCRPVLLGVAKIPNFEEQSRCMAIWTTIILAAMRVPSRT